MKIDALVFFSFQSASHLLTRAVFFAKRETLES